MLTCTLHTKYNLGSGIGIIQYDPIQDTEEAKVKPYSHLSKLEWYSVVDMWVWDQKN